MNIFKVSRIIDRLDRMMDNALSGRPVEKNYDETKMSALETKLNHYLKMTQTSQNHLAEEKERINHLISDISHQTKTPIANILLYAQLLEEGSLTEKDRQCLTQLIVQAEKLNFLIASLIKASRLEAGIISTSPKLQPIHPLLEQILSQVEPKAHLKNIAITYEGTDSYAVFDRKWTGEAVYNIVDNGVKYTKKNGEIKIAVIPYQLFLRIDIRDTGIGISEEETAKIFTRFYRSPAVGDEEGVGIGLYLAREIIRSQGGYIKVCSKPGKGSAFSVFLPMEG